MMECQNGLHGSAMNDIGTESAGSELPQTVLDKIARGISVSNSEFDLLYPEQVRRLSEIHWTPVETAKRAASFAVVKPGARVLDVGSGAGKFCIVGALTTNGNFFGVEQRGPLVKVASKLSKKYNISRVQFFHKNALDTDWSGFDSIYLFNPFSENLDETIRIDHLCELNAELYVKYIRYTQAKLYCMPIGTRVVVLNKFGGDLPSSYRLVHREEIGYLPLEAWEKK
ncbi:MAG: methyltransferase domain-containing protein [Bdellovibrionia bacterium]